MSTDLCANWPVRRPTRRSRQPHDLHQEDPGPHRGGDEEIEDAHLEVILDRLGAVGLAGVGADHPRHDQDEGEQGQSQVNAIGHEALAGRDQPGERGIEGIEGTVMPVAAHIGIELERAGQRIDQHRVAERHDTRQGTRYTIGPVVRREILDRLLELNHARYAAEVKAGLHDKKTPRERPAQENPGEQALF